MPKPTDRDRLLVDAAQRGDTALVEELLKEGADPNTTSGGASPLVFAAEEGHIDIVRLLLQAGANINEGDNGNITPLICASTRGYAPIVRLLLDAGADTTRMNWNLAGGRIEGTALGQTLERERRLQAQVLTTDNPALLQEQQRNYAEVVKMLQQADDPEA